MADIKSLKAKKFLSMLPDRQKRFDEAEAKFPTYSDNASVIAKALHPKMQYLKVAEIKVRAKDCKSYTLVPDEERGTTSLAWFGAGKYLTVFEEIEQRNYFSFYDYEYYLDVTAQHELMENTKTLEEGLKESFEWYVNNQDKVNKKPFIEYIDKNLKVIK